jgi:hypothetical protein
MTIQLLWNILQHQKMMPETPKMEFMADLAASKNGLITGKLSKEQVVESLKKMLAQDKNANVKDQIYFYPCRDRAFTK